MGYSSIPIGLLRLKIEGTPLTRRERDVVRLLALGSSQHEIAEKLGISYETVRKYAKSARARLGAKTNSHAVSIALSLDLI